jgi:hypothetical protein
LQPAPTNAHAESDTRISWQGTKSLLLDKRLLIFAECVMLFFAASAAMGPGVVVAMISPWIGRRVESSGRRPLMLVGWALIPLQGFIYATRSDSLALVFGNLLNAFSAAIFGVTMTVVAADLTAKLAASI